MIEYLLKKGLNAKEIHEDMVKTDSECAPSYATVKRWVIEFKHGRESLKDNDRCGAPVTVKTPEKISEVLAMVMKDSRFTVRHIGETLGLTSTTVYEILKNDLQMTKVSARWVPRLLTPEQKVIRMNQSSMATIHQCGFEIVPHPPYSPDLAPSDYHLFPNLKKHIGGTRFADDDDVMRVVEGYFGSLSKTVFYEGINKLRHRWEKCVRLKGDYVEK